eukprot:scaffold8551_cov117-Skeletonema_dohrnii-CCMP3373.AAC.1
MDSNLTSVRGGDSDSPKDVVKLSRMMLLQGRLYRCGLEVCWLRRACDRHDAKAALSVNLNTRIRQQEKWKRNGAEMHMLPCVG